MFPFGKIISGIPWATPGSIGSITPAAGSFTTLATSGDVTLTSDVSLGAGKHVVLPQHNDAATPTFAFGDGDTGFYESADDTLVFATGGNSVFQFIGNTFTGRTTEPRATMINEQATATNPGFIFSNDEDTGIGSAAADQLSLIAGGVEAVRMTEATTITTRFSDKTSFSNTAEGNTGSMNIQTARELHTLASAATSDTTLNIPSGAMLLGASFTVNTAVTSSAASNTWDADFITGSTTALVAAGASGAQNTKANALIVPEIASDTTNIQFDAAGAETFTAGVIEIIVYYIDQTSLANV